MIIKLVFVGSFRPKSSNSDALIKPFRAGILIPKRGSSLNIHNTRFKIFLKSGMGEIGCSFSRLKPADSKKEIHSESVYSCSPLSRRENGLSVGNPLFANQLVS